MRMPSAHSSPPVSGDDLDDVLEQLKVRTACARWSPTVRFPSLEHAGEPMLDWARLVHVALHAKGRAGVARRKETSMQTDSDVREAVLCELGWDARVRETDVSVEANAGVVALTGTLGSWAERVAAQEAAHRVAGVLDVVNDIEVNLPASSARTDTELAHAVRTALQCDVLVPDTRVESTVAHGAVTLAGEVEFESQREDAEKAIRNLAGVRHLVNKIRVKAVHFVSSLDVKRAIEAALARRLARELSHIEVVVKEGHVSLSGTMPSWAERRAAIDAATSTLGVRSVEDHLRIEP